MMSCPIVWKVRESERQSYYILNISSNGLGTGFSFVSELAFLSLYCSVKKLVHIALYMLDADDLLVISFLADSFQAEFGSCMEFKEHFGEVFLFLSHVLLSIYESCC